MTLLLDTNILVDIEHGTPGIMKRMGDVSKQDPSQPAISFVSHFEFLWGLRNKKDKYKMSQSGFINEFIILQSSRVTPIIMCSLRQKYELRGAIISLGDLIIASLAIEHNMTLVTKDKDFQKIEELSKIIL